MVNKICLINPPTTGQASKDVYFPMGLICLASILKEHNVPSVIVDFDLDLKKHTSLANWGNFLSHALRQLETSGCQIFGISSICSNYPISLLFANEIKKKWPDAKVILGGPQPSSVPEETLKACPSVDVIAIGESEKTILDLANTDWDLSSLEKIPGIAYLENGLPKITARRPLIENLDELPIPDFSVVPVEEYLAISPGTALIEAGRGCPFLCSFCSTSIMWERSFRVKTPTRIHEEMKRLNKSYGLKSFGLTHDNFTTSHRYVAEFSSYFEKNNIEGFIWSSSARPDTLNSERIQALHRAGCRGVFLGVDSGSDHIQKTMQKFLNLNHYRAMLREMAALNIEVTSSFIMGFAEETEEDFNQTISLALESRLMGAANIQFHRLAPLAGTAVLQKNQTDLSLYRGPSDVSLLPISDRVIDSFIEKHPLLFSSFYSIRTPEVEHINISALSVFYSALINQAATVLERTLKALGKTPTGLFAEWMDWREENNSIRAIDETSVLNTFGSFLTSRTLISQRAASGPSQSI